MRAVACKSPRMRQATSPLVLGLAFALAAWIPAGAQGVPSSQAPAPPVIDEPTAPVVVDGVSLFRVRGVTSYPAEQRAAEISSRIRALGSNRSVPVDSIRTESTPLATWIVASGERLMGITDADAQLEGTTPAVLAEVARRRISDAVIRYRHDREASYLSQRVGYALAATVAFLFFMVSGVRVGRRLRSVFEARYRSRMHDVHVRSVEIVRADQLWQWVQRAIRLAGVVIAVTAGYVYLNYVLLQFPWTRGAGNNLARIQLQPLQTIAAGLIGFIPDLVFLILLAMVTRFALRFTRVFMRRVASGEIQLESFDPEWAVATERILRFVVVVFALIIAYPYIPGSGSEAFKGIGLILGLMFSLGSPSVIGTMVAGLSLAFRKAFRVGDRVKIGEHSGFVSQVRLLTTYVRSFKNEEIVIPNSIILNSEVVNYTTLSKAPGLILHTTVGIGYETPWRQVEAMLLEAAARTPGVLETPAPFVLQKKLGDFAIEYEINGYSQEFQTMGLVYTDLHRNILDVFNEYGVQIMTPAYEGDPEQPKVVAREQWFSSPAKPKGVERVVDHVPSSVPADLSPRSKPPASA